MGRPKDKQSGGLILRTDPTGERRIYNTRTRRWELEGSPVRSIFDDPKFLTAVGDGKDGIVMPFGKFRGLQIDEVETEYLKWVLRECDLDPDFKKGVEEELSSRD